MLLIMLFETSIFITTVRACQVGCARLRLTQLLANALIINDINNIDSTSSATKPLTKTSKSASSTRGQHAAIQMKIKIRIKIKIPVKIIQIKRYDGLPDHAGVERERLASQVLSYKNPNYRTLS